MIANSITAYKEESNFKKVIKKIFKFFFKKEYVLVIDETNLLLPEANLKDIDENKEFNPYDAYTKITRNELKIEMLTQTQLLDVLNILNEKLVEKSKDLNKKILGIENKLESMSA